MKTVVLGTPPADLEAMLTRRRALGQLFDEVADLVAQIDWPR